MFGDLSLERRDPMGVLRRANMAVCVCAPVRALAAAGFAYEAVAIASRRLPTISAVSAKHRRLIPAVLAVLAVHLAVHPDNH